jgi:23S rRNA pseudouridine2605 synthase
MPPVRLQKFLAESGIGSRRFCETLIQRGKVSVNGQPAITLGTKIDPARDRVLVAGKPVTVERKIYIALNKPAGVVCTSRDAHGRPRVLDLLPPELPRLYTVGRLDQDSEGLLLLTNDGNFSLRLTHPRYTKRKIYRVQVEGCIDAAQITRLLRGIRSDGERLTAKEIFNVERRGERTELRVVLTEGKKRQIRRMFAAAGHRVLRLERVGIDTLELGNLKQGQWRYLSDEEVRKLLGD